MVKTLKGFILGLAVCFVLTSILGYYTNYVSAADEPSETSDELDLTSLLPDIGKIYRSALGSPYRQVKSEITDPDIASFFERFMAETGLDKIGEEP